MSDLTLKILEKTEFKTIYKKLLLGKCIKKDYTCLLSIAVIFLNSSDNNIVNLGYRIILLYTLQTKDYFPLYEVSLKNGFFPVTKLVEKNSKSNKDNIYVMLNRAMMEDWHKERIYLTNKQKELIEFFREKTNESLLINAPTSYGKTDLILTLINQCQNKKICILTPTKALLHQTRNRIKKAFPSINKIIVNPEMYNSGDETFVAVLTQERLLRLLKENSSLSLDIVVVDESQNLFEDEQRSILLSFVIIILNKRNQGTVFKFLSPFVCDENNLNISYTNFSSIPFRVNEYVKSELVYLYNVKEKKGLKIYDQYLDDFISIENEQKDLDSISFIRKYGSEKNIIYFNKPKDIEAFTRLLVDDLPEIPMNEAFDRAVASISESVHSDYYLVKALKKGVVYHHGSMPENIRSFIEALYSNEKEIRYIVTSSTLLEGVNLPATSLFMMSCKKGPKQLSSSSLKNLFGRICRFNEVFHEKNGSLEKLLPKVFFVWDRYYDKRTNLENYIKKHIGVERKLKDCVENPLMEKSIDKSGKENAVDFIENFQNGSIEDYKKKHVSAPIAKACVLNNIAEINLLQHEKELQKKYEKFLKINNHKVGDVESFLDLFIQVFLPFITDCKENKNLLRLANVAAQRFYKTFIDLQLENTPFSHQVLRFVDYWEKLIREKRETVVYVGRWGDITKSFWDGLKNAFVEGYEPNWVDIKEKNPSEKINLAIVRIKEEQDFIENSLMKFVEVLKDCGEIEEEFYMKIKYGTIDEQIICMIKNGITKSTAKLLHDKYDSYYEINLELGNVNFEEGLINAMRENGENEIIIYEMKSFL